MRQPKAGLLCLYVKLYDDTQAWLRKDVEWFQEQIASELEKTGLELIRHDICRQEKEFQSAISKFEEQGADAVITLHLAYSPSLESEQILKNTRLPILVLDTTPDYSFDGMSGAGRIMQNHGIHGVQDMCSLLRRNHVPYEVFAGHYLESDVIRNAAQAAKGAMMAARMKQCRVGRIGEPFTGMGDFRLPDEVLQESTGISIIDYDFNESLKLLGSITEAEIKEEWDNDCRRFDCRDLTYDVYAESARVNLAVRKWIGNNKLDAFTVNFMATDENPALPRMPFMETCKAMENGIGYAGEGDVLTASFTAALMNGYEETTFAEMFCPDWKGNTVFLSHMGEYNLRVCAGKPLLTELDFPYTSAGNPAALYGCMKEGRAAFVNLNPLSEGRFVLIMAAGTMVEMTETAPEFEKTVRGWFRPDIPVAEFLSAYSKAGGGHHGAIVYHAGETALRMMAEVMGWDFCRIG